MRVLIIGCGYVGLALGTTLRRAGHTVFGLRRNRDAEPELRAAGLEPLWADLTDAGTLAALEAPFDWVVQCAAAGGGTDSYRRVYVQGTRNVLAWLSRRPPRRFVYTSSTGVYGQNDGSWVTEDCPTEPASEAGRVLLEAEALAQAAHRDTGFPAVIVRPAGIYGPGRGYWLKQFLAGRAMMEGDGSRFLNMVHRDDLVSAMVATLEQGVPGEVYNVVDDEPVRQRDLFAWMAEHFGRPLPPSAPADEVLRKRGVTNKRVSNRKLREQLDWQPRYPTFREGFAVVATEPA